MTDSFVKSNVKYMKLKYIFPTNKQHVSTANGEKYVFIIHFTYSRTILQRRLVKCCVIYFV